MLVTQRNPNKKAGGLWEFIGGGVLAGETTAQAAVREIKEEIGVNIAETELTFLYEYKHRNYFLDIYSFTKDIKIDDIVLDTSETVNAKWISKEEWEEMINEQIAVHSVALRYNIIKNKLR